MPKLNKKKILVIGSNSFSGSNFIKILLKKGHSVIGISRSNELKSFFLPYKDQKIKNNFEFYKIDLNKNLNRLIKIIKKEKFSFIANFAAQGMVNESWKKPIDWYQTNIISQIKLIEELKKFSFIKKYMHVTTPEVYGSTTQIKNDWSFKPSTPYAISRAASDYHLKALFLNSNFPVVFTRAANVYGSGQQLYRIVPKTIFFLKNKKKIRIDGGGVSKRSFIYIDDVVDAYYNVLFKGKIGETYFVTSSNLITIKKLVQKISTLMKVPFKDAAIVLKKDRSGKDEIYKLNNKKCFKEFNWKPKISLEEGVNLTKNWIEQNIEKINLNYTKYKHKK
jgi:dTDP-glucose 4,6-dehydratase